MKEPAFLTSTNASSCTGCMGCGGCMLCGWCGTCGLTAALLAGVGVTVSAVGYVSGQWWG